MILSHCIFLQQFMLFFGGGGGGNGLQCLNKDIFLLACSILFPDKESAFDEQLSEMDEEFQDYVMDSWETQFCPVAEQLLQRLESHQSNFEPLP